MREIQRKKYYSPYFLNTTVDSKYIRSFDIFSAGLMSTKWDEN